MPHSRVGDKEEKRMALFYLIHKTVFWGCSSDCIFAIIPKILCVKHRKVKNGIAFIRVLEYNIIYNRQGV